MDLTVVVPTRNEEANIDELVERTSASLRSLGLEWELLFVDDSDDGTPDRVREAAGRGYPVRLLHRPSQERRGGLSGAVSQGFDGIADSSLLAVMDGDLQHRPEVLVGLVNLVHDGAADLAIASRRRSLTSASRRLERCWRSSVSGASRALVHRLFPRSALVSDPMAGFFVMRRSVIECVQLRPEGFKILLEVLVRGSWSTVVEVPCELDPRLHGESKADLAQGVAFARHLVRLVARRSSARPADLLAREDRPTHPCDHAGKLNAP